MIPNRGWLAVFAVIALVAGCADPTPAPSGTSAGPQSPAAPPTASSASDTTAAPALRWVATGDGLEIADLKVPRDYAEPGGSQLTIALARFPASDPANRIGSIVFNPGGPGVSGIDAIRYGAAMIFTPAMRAHFDIVGFDPRGIGLSSPRVECPGAPPQPDQPYPRSASERAAWIATAKEIAAACQRKSGELLPFLGTENVARDLERIRGALGEPKLTYVGGSYGTLIGALYAEQFPNRIRAMILDAPGDPAVDIATGARETAAAVQRQLDLFLAWCANDRTCAFWSDGLTWSAFDALMARFADAPINGVSAWTAWWGVRTALAAGMWQELAQALANARKGDATFFANMAAGITSLMEAMLAVNCVDWPYARDADWYAKLADELRSTAPDFAAFTAYSGLACAFWPVPDRRVPAPVHATGSPAIVLFASTGDPAMPYSSGVSLSRQLSSSVLVTRDGDGHGSLGRGDACINAIADDYLLRLEVPAPGTTCP